jgi:hypothetical protein
MDVVESLPDELRMDSIASRLTDTESQFRRQLMDFTISRGVAVNVHAEPPAELSAFDPKPMIAALLEKKAAALGDSGDVDFVYPVSAVATGYRVTLADGRSFSAMCAIDAIGAAFTFEQNVLVDSKCHTCHAAIELEVRDGEISRHRPEEIHVLHVDLSKYDVWAGTA